MTPFVSVEGHRELLQELIKQGMPPVEYHHGIVQPSPVACPCVHGLCSDAVPETAEAFEDYDIGVDVNTAVLVQDGEAEQVGEVLAEGDLSGADFPSSEPMEPGRSRRALQEVGEVRGDRRHAKPPLDERFEKQRSKGRVHGVGDDKQAGMWVELE